MFKKTENVRKQDLTSQIWKKRNPKNLLDDGEKRGFLPLLEPKSLDESNWLLFKVPNEIHEFLMGISHDDCQNGKAAKLSISHSLACLSNNLANKS